MLKKLPIRKYILLESSPSVSDNTRAVFLEMINRGINKKYKLIWILENDGDFPKYKNVRYFVKNTKNKLNLFLYTYYLNTAKCLISCNRSLGKVRSEQRAFYLMHGTPIKSVISHYSGITGNDFMFVTSENVKELCAREFAFDLSKVYAIGYPRNDELTNCRIDLNKLLGEQFDKIIIWYPTFRQNKSEAGFSLDVAPIPLIYNEQKALELNRLAKEKNILIIVKPHFAQKIDMIRDLGLSNIWFIDDSFFARYKVSSYQFVGNCDALLTDYSSIYYDFTLCDKPIGAIWEDIEDYRKQQGFSVDIDFMMKGAEKIFTFNQLLDFVCRVSQGVDLLKVERNEIKKYVNKYTDGLNSKRVVDFILDQL